MWIDRFLVSTSCVTIWNLNLLSSSETGVNPGIRSWEKHLSDWARCQKASGDIYFTKKWRAETLQPGLEFGNFKPRLKSCIFECISWLNGSFFGGVFESWSQDLSNGTSVNSLTCQLFFCCPHIYCVWISHSDFSLGHVRPGCIRLFML